MPATHTNRPAHRSSLRMWRHMSMERVREKWWVVRCELCHKEIHCVGEERAMRYVEEHKCSTR